jgi:hypothetical protein
MSSPQNPSYPLLDKNSTLGCKWQVCWRKCCLSLAHCVVDNGEFLVLLRHGPAGGILRVAPRSKGVELTSWLLQFWLGFGPQHLCKQVVSCLVVVLVGRRGGSTTLKLAPCCLHLCEVPCTCPWFPHWIDWSTRIQGWGSLCHILSLRPRAGDQGWVSMLWKAGRHICTMVSCDQGKRGTCGRVLCRVWLNNGQGAFSRIPKYPGACLIHLPGFSRNLEAERLHLVLWGAGFSCL